MTAVLETVERQTGPDPAWTVLWLHGLGADGNDFAPLVPELVRPQWPALRFVFPHAPVRPVTINGGMRMRAWYDIAGMDFTDGLRRQMPLAGLIALSTYLPSEARMLAARVPGAETQPVFMAHGMFDPVVPFSAGRRSAQTLEGLGFAVDWKSYPMQHQVCAEQIRDLGDWLQHRFDAA